MEGTVKLAGSGLGGAGLVMYTGGMTTPRDPIYAGHRYPAEIISYAVWLYLRGTVNLADFETEFGNNLASEPAGWILNRAWTVSL